MDNDDEEYLENELNTLMKEYKKNEINRDIFYEDQKREKLKDAERERLSAENDNKIEEVLDEPDPWMSSKFKSSKESATEAATTSEDAAATTSDAATSEAATSEAASVTTEDNSTEESKIKTI